MSIELAQVGKTCSCCQQDRPIERFLPSPLSPDGFTDRCMPCIRAAAEQDRIKREVRRPGSKSGKRRSFTVPSPSDATIHAGYGR